MGIVVVAIAHPIAFSGGTAKRHPKTSTAQGISSGLYPIARNAKKNPVNDAKLLKQGLLARINGAYRMELMYEAQGLKFDALWWFLERFKLKLILLDLSIKNIGSEEPQKLAF